MPDPHADDPLLAPLLALGQALRDAGHRFTTTTPATHARVNARPGNEEAHDLAGIFGWSRPFRPDTVPAPLLRLMEQAGVLRRDGALCRSTVRASTLHGELFLHSAFPTTAADAVFFGPDTYRFADAVLHALRNRTRPVRRAVDVCCGAGPGGIVVAKALPGAAVFMADINDAALRLARVNARLAGTPGAEARHSDLLTALDGSFDLIVANPPYLVDPAERAYRHGGGPLGAGLSLAILDAALDRLAPGGTLALYTGVAVVKNEDPFRTAAAGRLARGGLQWTYREIDPTSSARSWSAKHTDKRIGSRP